ncbi:MAG: hypothetical protein EA421_10025 [Gemmatimonadales bacterium]|nr:MAG: hypothetical protein EA421_10025 [Gemmatimonadales bacterium]
MRHVLEGSVRRTGDALRITAQLIDAEPVLREQLHFWLGQNILADAVFPGMRACGETAMAALERDLARIR